MFKYLIGDQEVIFQTWDEAVKAIDAARKKGLSVKSISDKPEPQSGPVLDFTIDSAISANVGSGPFPAPEKKNTESQSEDIFSDLENITLPEDLLEIKGSYAKPGEFVQGPSININYDQIAAEAGIKLEPEVEEVIEEVVEDRKPIDYRQNQNKNNSFKGKKPEKDMATPEQRALNQKVREVRSLGVNQILDESGLGFTEEYTSAEYRDLLNQGPPKMGDEEFGDPVGRDGWLKRYTGMVMAAFENGGQPIEPYEAEELVEDYFETKEAKARLLDTVRTSEVYDVLNANGQKEYATKIQVAKAISQFPPEKQKIGELNNRKNDLDERIKSGNLSAKEIFIANKELAAVKAEQQGLAKEVMGTSLLKFNEDGEIIGIKTEKDVPMYNARGEKLNDTQIAAAITKNQTLYGGDGDVIDPFGGVLSIEGLNTQDKVKNQFVTNSVQLNEANALGAKVIGLKPKGSKFSMLWNPGMYNRGVALHQLNQNPALYNVLEESTDSNKTFNGRRKKDEEGYLYFTVDEVAEAIALGDWDYGDFEAKGLEGTGLDSRADFAVFHEERKNLAIKQSVLDDMVVLGADLSTMEKDSVKDMFVEFGRNAAINVPFLGNQFNKDIGATRRVLKDNVRDVYGQIGIAETDEMAKNFDRYWGMHLAEGAGAFVPVLAEFAVVNYMTGGLASATGLTSVTNGLLKSRYFLPRMGGHMLKGLGEEIKFKIVTKGESKTGSGFGFYAGGALTRNLFRNVRINPTKEYANPINKAFQNIILGGVGGATAGEVALVTEAFYDAAMGNKTFQRSMEEMFGEDVDIWQRWSVAAVQFGMLGGYNNFKEAYNRAGLSEISVLNNKYKLQLETAKKNKDSKYTIEKLEQKVEATDQIIDMAKNYANLRNIKWLKGQNKAIESEIDRLTKEPGGGNYSKIKQYKKVYLDYQKRADKLLKRAEKKAAKLTKDNKGLTVVVEKIEGERAGGDFDPINRKITYDPDFLNEGVIQHEMGHDAIVELANTPEGRNAIDSMVESISSRVEQAWKASGKKGTYEEFLNRATDKTKAEYSEEYIMRLVEQVVLNPVLASNLMNKGILKSIQADIQNFARNYGGSWAEGKFNMSEANSPHRADNVLDMVYKMANSKNKGYKRNKKGFNALANLFVNAKEQQNVLGEDLNPANIKKNAKKFSKEIENEAFDDNSKLNKEINAKYVSKVSSRNPRELGEELQFDFISRVEGLMNRYLKVKDLNLSGNTEFGSDAARAQRGLIAMEATNFIMDARTMKQKESGGDPVSLGDLAIKPYAEGQNFIKVIKDQELSIEEATKLFKDGGYGTGAKTIEDRVKDLHDMATGKKPMGSLTTYVHEVIALTVPRAVDANIKGSEKEVFLEGDQTMEFLSNEMSSRGEVDFADEVQMQGETIVDAYTVQEKDQGYKDRAGENRRNAESAMDVLSITPKTREKIDKIVDEELGKPMEGLEAQAIGTIDLGNGKVYEVEIPTEKNRALTFDSKGEREEHKSFQKPKDLALKLQKREKAKATRESIDQSKTPEQRAEAKAEADRLDRLEYKKDFVFVKEPKRLFKVNLERTVEEALYEDIRAEMGEIGSKENLYWLAKTQPLMKNYIGLSQITKRFPGLYEPVMVKGKDGKLKQAREKTAAGAKLFKRTEITPADYFEYFKNDAIKQASLAKALAREFAFDRVVDKIASGAAKNIVMRQGGKDDLAKLEGAGQQIVYKHIQRFGIDGFTKKYSLEIESVANERGIKLPEAIRLVKQMGIALRDQGVEASNNASLGAQITLDVIKKGYTDMWIESANDSNSANIYKKAYAKSYKTQYDPLAMKPSADNIKLIEQRTSDMFSLAKAIFRDNGIYDLMENVGVSKTKKDNFFDFFLVKAAGFTGERMFKTDYNKIVKGIKSKAEKEYLRDFPEATKKQIAAAGNEAAKPFKMGESKETHPTMGPKKGRDLFAKAEEGIEGTPFAELKESLSTEAFKTTVKELGDAVVDARTKMDAFKATDLYTENFAKRGKGKNGEKGKLSVENNDVTFQVNSDIARKIYEDAVTEVMGEKGKDSEQYRAKRIEQIMREKIGDKGFEALEAEHQLAIKTNTFMLSLLGKMNTVDNPRAHEAVHQLANMMYGDRQSGYRSLSPYMYFDLSASFINKMVKSGKTMKEVLDTAIGNEHVKTRTAFFAEVFKNLNNRKPGEGLDNPLVVKGIAEGYWSLLSPEFKQKLVDGSTFPKRSGFDIGVQVKSAALPEKSKLMLTLAKANTPAEMNKVWARLGPRGSGPEMADVRRLFFARNFATNKSYLEKLIEDYTTITEAEPVKELATASESNKKYSKEIEGASEDMNGKQLVEALSIEEIRAKREAADKGKNLEKELAGMIERKGGAPAEATVSNSKAFMEGKKRYDDLFLPSSSEDLQGLLYKPYGKGKQGDADMEFMNEHILRPLTKAENALSVYRMKLAEDYSGLEKQITAMGETKPEKAAVKRVGEMGYNIDQAVRVYIWSSLGMKIPGISVSERSQLVGAVAMSKKLRAYAEGIMNITKTKQKYPEPTENWFRSNVQYDLFTHATDGVRSDFLYEWQENVDAMFTKENLNKLEARFGGKYRYNLEQMLTRIKIGKSRPESTNEAFNTTLNYINGSVATIMFLNMRSAALQTISAANYVNWTDNNPIEVAKVITENPKLFMETAKKIWSSDALRDRRTGLKINVQEAEMAKAIKSGGRNAAQEIWDQMIQIGFKPTQMADSFAIVMGGTPFYMNRMKTYEKEGLSKNEAADRAFEDFLNKTQEGQQSSQMDRVSNIQTGLMGRLVFSFNNTPFQMSRLQKKAFLDLKNNRGDKKTNVSRMAYYGLVQSSLFYGLQQAFYGSLMSDDAELSDEEQVEKYADFEKRLDKLSTSVWQGILSGSGLPGKGAVVTYNTGREAYKQYTKGYQGSDFFPILSQIMSLSPTLGSKVNRLGRNWKSLIMAEHTKKGREYANTFGTFDPRNPNAKAYISMIGTATNIPVDRLIAKMENVSDALDTNNEIWQRVAMFMGTPKYQLQTKEQNKRDRQQIIDDFYKENTPKGQRDLDAIEMLTIKEQKAWLVSLGIRKDALKMLKTQNDRSRAIKYITNELGLDIEKEYMYYDIPIKKQSPEYIEIKDLKKDGQIELLREYGVRQDAIDNLDNQDKRIKLILAIKTQRENSLK